MKVIEKKQKKEVHLEVEWSAREDGFKPTNSLIDSKILLEHCPEFVLGFYESKVRLIPGEGND